ncbi:hypothetical protein QBC47DRAFT_385847 [Echria macrotheca]|uniref:C2H2-type domain-containing protein n=1 Tax=Echria macrotheca TaxID=438768 RepID=A0AAJ0FAD9_9PEZI|nr:hypothetical protein QBC47DRAFT_385847 [Echria macrotheca]
MSRAIQQWQCRFCFASFPSRELLESHFDEYRARAAELEKCHAHANANESPEDEDEELNTISKNTYCPYAGCSRTKPFSTGQQLWVHFGTHVPCREVCVYCFKVIDRASEYIRHARTHNSPNESKKVYTAQTCDSLRKLVKKELLKALLPRTANKRTWEEAGMGSDSGCGNIQGHDVVGGGSHLPDGSNTSLYSIELASNPKQESLTQVANAAGLGEFAGILTQPQPRLNTTIPTPEVDPFDAPLFHSVNFIQHPFSVEGSIGVTDMQVAHFTA